jgi:hypothetical protein
VTEGVHAAAISANAPMTATMMVRFMTNSSLLCI